MQTMKTQWKLSACILLCTVSFIGCVQKNNKENLEVAQSSGVIHIQSEQEFDTAICRGNVVVDFYASWCGPCQRMSPIIDDLAKEMTNVCFVKVDTEKFNALTKKFGVRGLPTLVFFKNGQKIHQATGARSKVELRNEINKTF